VSEDRSPSDVAAALLAVDRASQAFGIEVVEIDPERAVLQMVVRDDMCNGLGIGHGGMTFLLADTAMAFASNCGNLAAVVQSADIDLLAPVPAGVTLQATATRRWASSRAALWDVTVSIVGGGDVAVVRGRTRTTGAVILD
jgi:acyl-CoA thioesterase